jgi:S1-C subfamily serine protease
VWTASHVVDTVNETRIVQVIRSEGVKVGEVFFNASVIARDKESDLAVLWIQHAPPNYFTPVKFAGGAVPRVGSPVYHAGNFRGKVFDRSVSRGIVSQTGVRSPAGERWTWKVTDQADIHVIYGSSGGPLFDENQNILGLIVGLSPYVPGIAFFVPTRAVFSFAEEKNLMWAVSGSFAPSEAELFKLAKSAEVTPPEE